MVSFEHKYMNNIEISKDFYYLVFTIILGIFEIMFKFLRKKITVNDYVPEGCDFFAISPTYYEACTLTPFKYILVSDKVTEEVRKYRMIGEEHPLWDYNE